MRLVFSLSRTFSTHSCLDLLILMTNASIEQKIVKSMTEEERTNPQLMSDDLNDVENKCPRVQRLALESGVPERDGRVPCLMIVTPMKLCRFFLTLDILLPCSRVNTQWLCS